MLANSTYFSYPAPGTWGRLKTQGTSLKKDSVWPQERRQKWTKYSFCLVRKHFLWTKCNITSHKSFRNSFENHLKDTFVWSGGSSINVAPVKSFIYVFMHSVDSVIHVFTHSQGPVGGYACVCEICCRVGLCCGLVLFPRGLSSFTEPWQRMEAGRGVRCIKKPLPCSDLSPLPHIHGETHAQTHTQIHAYQPHGISPVLAAAQLFILSSTQAFWIHAHSQSHRHICTPSNIYSFYHKAAASEEKWRCKAPHYTEVVILHFNEAAPLPPLTQLVILVSCRLVGSEPSATSPQEDGVTQLQDSISRLHHLQTAAFECECHQTGKGGEQGEMNICVCTLGWSWLSLRHKYN